MVGTTTYKQHCKVELTYNSEGLSACSFHVQVEHVHTDEPDRAEVPPVDTLSILDNTSCRLVRHVSTSETEH